MKPEAILSLFPMRAVHYYYEGKTTRVCDGGKTASGKHQSSVCLHASDDPYDSSEHECLLMVYGETEDESETRAKALVDMINGVCDGIRRNTENDSRQD